MINLQHVTCFFEMSFIIYNFCTKVTKYEILQLFKNTMYNTANESRLKSKFIYFVL